MSQIKKTFLHTDQKKCFSSVSTSVKSVLVTLKTSVNDAKFTALFTGQRAHSISFLTKTQIDRAIFHNNGFVIQVSLYSGAAHLSHNKISE